MSKTEVGIVDTGAGNFFGLSDALQHVGARVSILEAASDVSIYDTIVLPGVGSFASVVRRLRHLEMDVAIRDAAQRGQKILGICLGLQLLMTRGSEGGDEGGFGLIAGGVQRLPLESEQGQALRIPNIGWSRVQNVMSAPGLDDHMDTNFEGDFFFAHSYYVQCDLPGVVLATWNWGGQWLPAVVADRNVVGMQFHPERSGPVGLELLRSLVVKVRSN